MKNNQHMEIKKILRVYNISHGMSASIIPLTEAENRGITLDLEEPRNLAPMIAGYDALLGLAEKRDLMRRVTSHEEIEKATARGFIPLLLPSEIYDRFNSIPSLSLP